MRRQAWIGDGTGPAVEEAYTADARLEDFAYGASATVLDVEPRLRTIAMLVERAGPLTGEQWRAVDVLCAAFLGQGRRLPIIVPVTSESAGVGVHLGGETTRKRFAAALRDLTGQVTR